MEPFSTSTTLIRMSSLIGGGGRCPSMTALQYARPDIDATVSCVAIGSRQLITRDCCAPKRVSCETLMSQPFRKLIGLLIRLNIAALWACVNQSVYYGGVNDVTPGTRRPGGRGARERIERTAARLFYRNGIHATGVELIAREANVSKRTLYQHFASKNDLVDNYLRGIEARGGAPTEKGLDATGLPARERLLAIFDLRRSEVVRGCPFHNAAVESAGSLASTDEIVRTHKHEFTRRLGAVAREAGAADPHLLGQQLAVLFEGATAMATSLNDTAPVVHARAAAATLIDAALADESSS